MREHTGCRCESEKGEEGEDEDGVKHDALLVDLWKGRTVVNLRGDYCCFMRHLSVSVTVISMLL